VTFDLQNQTYSEPRNPCAAPFIAAASGVSAPGIQGGMKMGNQPLIKE